MSFLTFGINSNKIGIIRRNTYETSTSHPNQTVSSLPKGLPLSVVIKSPFEEVLDFTNALTANIGVGVGNFC